MTATDLSPPLPQTDGPIAAAGGLHVGPPLVETCPPVPSILTASRSVGPDVLDLYGENWFRTRCCDHEPVKGWPDRCSPAYDPDNPDHVEKCSSGCMKLQGPFYGFHFYALGEVNCPDPGYDIADAAAAYVNDFSAWQVGRELDHAPISGSPSLRSVGLDLTPAGGPVSPVQALSILAHAYEGFGCSSEIVYHIPRALKPFFSARGLIETRGGLIRLTGEGNVVNPGPGLTGVGPANDATGNPTTPADMTADGVFYLYATRGGIEYRLSEPSFYGGEPQFHHQTNTWMVEAERQGVLRFNPSCVFAIAVNAKEPGCCC